MEKGIGRIFRIIKNNIHNDPDLQNFFKEFLDKELYVGHYKDQLEILIEKYSHTSGD